MIVRISKCIEIDGSTDGDLTGLVADKRIEEVNPSLLIWKESLVAVEECDGLRRNPEGKDSCQHD